MHSAPDAASSPPDGVIPSDEDILAALAAPAVRARTTVAYRASLFVVAGAMVLLPLVYLGLIAAVGWATWLHATTNVVWLHGRVSRGTMFAYVAPLAAGTIGILFMIKPLFAPRRRGSACLSLDPVAEPFAFRFVERLCGLVGAPVPRRIDVDTEANASASFRHGLRSFLGSDLVLTIGLPLVQGLSLRELAGVLAHEFGHFAQGGGMRLTYVIRAINLWFARVVYDRDAWDEQLTAWTHAGGWVSILLLACRGFVWLTRRILEALMVAGHAISCLALRQMEYDADRQETRVAGCAAFEATMDRLVELGVARHGALADLDRALGSQRVPDDLPALVLANVEELRGATAPPDRGTTGNEGVLATVLAASRESRTGLLDTHPSHRDRIAAARSRAEPGLFRVDAPATRLFADPAGLSRAATLAFYRDELAIDTAKVKIVPVAALAAESAARATARAAVARYFLGPLPVGAAFRPFLRAEPVPALPSVDVAVATRRLAAARDAMVAALPAIRSALAAYLEADAACDRAWAQSILFDAGLTPADETLPRTAAGRDEARRRAHAAAAERGTALEQLDRACDPVRSRIDAALRLRLLPETATAGPGAEIDRRLAALAALREGWGWIGELLDRTMNAMVVIQAIAERESPPESLVTAFQERVAGLREVLAGLREALAGAPFPYDHADEGVSIGMHLVPAVPAEDDHVGIVDAARVAVERENDLFLRLTAELVERAEAIEDALGLPRPETG